MYQESQSGWSGSGSLTSLIPINTLSSVRLHADNVGGTTICMEILFSKGDTLGVVISLGIAAVVALPEAIADNLDEFL